MYDAPSIHTPVTKDLITVCLSLLVIEGGFNNSVISPPLIDCFKLLLSHYLQNPQKFGFICCGIIPKMIRPYFPKIR